MPKNILIISRSTFPSKDPRSMRTDELAREMAKQGHKVILYVLTDSYDYTSFEKQTNITIKSLGKTYFSTYHHENGKKLNFFAKAFNKLVGKYVEFPDIELIRNVYTALKTELEADYSIDLLITIAVPHTIHWGATLFKKNNSDKLKNITWIADCGDPYMGNPLKTPPSYFAKIENCFCSNVDFITVPVKEAVKAYPYKFRHKIKVIPQGFNLENIESKNQYIKNTLPTFIYAGTFYHKYRDPSSLLDYLGNIEKDFRFIIYTKNLDLIEPYRKKLGQKLIVKPYISRPELLEKMKQADFLINLENPFSVQSPSKLIDYAIAQRPVLSINTNHRLNTDNIDSFLDGDYKDSLPLVELSYYDIKNVVKSFLALLD